MLKVGSKVEVTNPEWWRGVGTVTQIDHSFSGSVYRVKLETGHHAGLSGVWRKSSLIEIPPLRIVDKSKRVYIAGPISGKPLFNFPRFFLTAFALRDRGYEVENPADNDGVTLLDAIKNAKERPIGDWADYMRRDIPRMLKCQAICLLPDWESSKGVALELHIARGLGMTVCAWNGELGELVEVEL